jgi:hypothetical protein
MGVSTAKKPLSGWMCASTVRRSSSSVPSRWMISTCFVPKLLNILGRWLTAQAYGYRLSMPDSPEGRQLPTLWIGCRAGRGPLRAPEQGRSDI